MLLITLQYPFEVSIHFFILSQIYIRQGLERTNNFYSKSGNMWLDILLTLFAVVCQSLLGGNMDSWRKMVFHICGSCIHICECKLDGTSSDCIEWHVVGGLSFFFKAGFLKNKIKVDCDRILANRSIGLYSVAHWGNEQLMTIHTKRNSAHIAYFFRLYMAIMI